MTSKIMLLATAMLAATAHAADFRNVTCEGTYPHHLQGVCADDRAIYWSFTTELVKTDLDGKLLRKVPVPNHHGDLCFHDGKIYVAVNLGKFNDPQGNVFSKKTVSCESSLAFSRLPSMSSRTSRSGDLISGTCELARACR